MYESKGLQKIHEPIASGYPAVWLYQGIDPYTTVVGAAFFSDGVAQGMAVGDLIFAEENDNYYDAALLIVNTLSATAATAALVAPINPALRSAHLGELLALVAAMPRAAAKVETLAAARTLTAQDSGKTFFLAAAAGLAVTLPAPAAGLEFEFIVSVAVTSNGYTIATNGGANIIVIGVNELEVDTGDDGPYDDNADLVTLAANVAVPGDRIRMISDGTSWYAIGQTNADGGVTTATS